MANERCAFGSTHNFTKFDDDYIFCQDCGIFRRVPDDGRVKIVPPAWPGVPYIPYIPPNGTSDWWPYPTTITWNTWTAPRPDYTVTC